MLYHDPVLLAECIEGLAIKPEGHYVDATFGGGGHAKEILKKLTTGKLTAFDQDPDTMVNTIRDNRFMLLRHNFRYMAKYLRYYDSLPADGIIADLGISSHQLDTPSRGFSTRFDEALDMRMNPALSLTAKEILNSYPAHKLEKIFRDYSELPGARKIAAAILSARAEKTINTTQDLKAIIGVLAGRDEENRFYARLFQGLRIEVNDELGALKDFLSQTPAILKKGGRLVVISYHSLEDRLVKNFMARGKFEGEIEKDIYGNPERVPFRALTRKPVTPGEQEIKRNPRSRSAKLRIAERT
jgi:16S rRNA (cytosine1402-N4)-methyltransferase